MHAYACMPTHAKLADPWALRTLAALDLLEHLLCEIHKHCVAVLLRQVHHLKRGSQRVIVPPEHKVDVCAVEQQLRPALYVALVQEQERPIGGFQRILVLGTRAARLRDRTQGGDLRRAVPKLPRYHQSRLCLIRCLLGPALRWRSGQQAVREEEARGDLRRRPLSGSRELAGRVPGVLLHHRRLALLGVGARDHREGAGPPVHIVLVLEQLGSLPRSLHALAGRVQAYVCSRGRQQGDPLRQDVVRLAAAIPESLGLRQHLSPPARSSVRIGQAVQRFGRCSHVTCGCEGALGGGYARVACGTGVARARGPAREPQGRDGAQHPLLALRVSRLRRVDAQGAPRQALREGGVAHRCVHRRQGLQHEGLAAPHARLLEGLAGVSCCPQRRLRLAKLQKRLNGAGGCLCLLGRTGMHHEEEVQCLVRALQRLLGVAGQETELRQDPQGLGRGPRIAKILEERCGLRSRTRCSAVTAASFQGPLRRLEEFLRRRRLLISVSEVLGALSHLRS
mmetsp:Transcript_101436/g.322314  ORF Transcript_101436/g.322314 Transcript_101436/m.322314 type:complete len:509 (-) Transcript_101436:39-1565(-)